MAFFVFQESPDVMLDKLFGKKNEPAKPRHGNLPSPLGLRLGAAVTLDSILSKVLSDGRFLLEMPAPGTPQIVKAQGLIDLGDGVKLHRFYLDDDCWIQVRTSAGATENPDSFDEIMYFGFGDVLTPTRQSEFDDIADLIGRPLFGYCGKNFNRLWGEGEGHAATADYRERVYPIDDGSFEVRHQDMLHSRDVEETDRQEFLLVSVETDETNSISVVHSVGMLLSRSDLDIV